MRPFPSGRMTGVGRCPCRTCSPPWTARGGEAALANLQPDDLMRPESVAEAYWALHQQARDGWTFEMDLRPSNQQQGG